MHKAWAGAEVMDWMYPKTTELKIIRLESDFLFMSDDNSDHAISNEKIIDK